MDGMNAPIREVSDGELVFEQGDVGRSMYVVDSGKVDIFRTKHEKEIKLASLGAGEYFGEMSLLLDAPRSASARAVGDTTLRVIDKAAFKSMPVDNPVIWDLMTAMGERIAEVNSQLETHEASNEMRKEALSSFISSRRNFY